MGDVILGVTVSLDGFAEDSNGSVGALYPDLEELDDSELMRDSIRNTGSVVMAWKEFAMAGDPDWYAGNYEYQVPIFVVGDTVPEKHPKEAGKLSFHFITEGFTEAIRQAKEAAGDKEVNIIGSADTTRLCLMSGLIDRFELEIIPAFLHTGFRPFEELTKDLPDLELKQVKQLPAGRVHLEYRVRQPGK